MNLLTEQKALSFRFYGQKFGFCESTAGCTSEEIRTNYVFLTKCFVDQVIKSFNKSVRKRKMYVVQPGK